MHSVPVLAQALGQEVGPLPLPSTAPAAPSPGPASFVSALPSPSLASLELPSSPSPASLELPPSPGPPSLALALVAISSMDASNSAASDERIGLRLGE
jgi:hypothetical protein